MVYMVYGGGAAPTTIPIHLLTLLSTIHPSYYSMTDVYNLKYKNTHRHTKIHCTLHKT